ncbi:putative nitrate/nitrite response transcriptional regulatory protein NarL (LuxR family) [Mycolicibacterium anyangense]|uniref:Putative nitrate/nitrite response transcriptional regulatory protein NarL (LuxR family) n=1 Tax=Mycolicibacterium anyangense TaxID=1431246 RepID=A0A6N4W607_9MYCO|nr:response regulator transcription factor [Mycolicibacterium anyangense]BBZ75958.1 putative nitrate/nitrite response transcriptional regulatory protein NarL (LuxR family) [Mycolicibacterium anyangense]
MQTSETRTRVVVCDDHPLFREGMVRVLRASGLDVIGEAADGRAALEIIRELSPDVAVVDYKMPGLDGVALAHAVTRDELPTKVLLVSAFDDSTIVYEALSSGALGFISKEAPPEQVVDAVRAIARGEEVVPLELARGLAAEVRKRAKGTMMVLTPRELEVVRFIAEGLSVPEISKQIHLSPATVRTHIHNLYEKLGVSDRGAAVAEAMRRRLLE